MYANLTSALPVTTKMPAKHSHRVSGVQAAKLQLQDAETALQYIKEAEEAEEAEELEQREFAFKQREFALKQRELELKQRELELNQREWEHYLKSELEERDSALAEVRQLLVATLDRESGLVDLIELLAEAVLDRPADSVTCPAIAKRTRMQCKCMPMQNGYCYHHQDQVPKNE
jgi:hypothetical protein